MSASRASAVIEPIREGVLDLTHHDFDRQPVELTGEWAFFWSRLLTSEDADDVVPDTMMPVPGYWNVRHENTPAFPTTGVASYRLRVLLPDNAPRDLAIKLISINYAHAIWVNGEKISAGGDVTLTGDAFIPDSTPGIHAFRPGGDTLDIIIHVANDGFMQPGLWTQLHLGVPEHLHALRFKRLSWDVLMIGCAIIMGIYHLGLYFTRREPELLYFALMSVSMSAVTLASGEYFFFQLFDPSQWRLLYTLFHVGWFSGIGLLLLYLAALLPGFVPVGVVRAVTGVCIVSVASAIVLPPQIYTRTQDLYSAYTLVIGVFAATVLIRASLRNVEGARFFLAAFSVFMLGVTNDVLFSYGYVNSTYIVPFCFMTFVTAQALLLARRYSSAFVKAESLGHALEQKAAEMEAGIQQRTAELEAARSHAEAASRTKSEFLATMSHELRTPLNGMIGMIELLRDAPLADAERHYLTTLDLSTRALQGIISDILDFSNIEAGRLVLDRKTFNLYHLIEECASIFGSKSLEKGARFNVSVLPSLPRMVVSDPTRLRQVLLHLLSNAFKFAEQGEISLCISNLDEQNPGRIRFDVTDTGIGIPEEKQSELFASFEQLDASTTRRYGGAGLGLAIAKRLTTLLGGDIGFYSQPGRGSCFWFTIDAQMVEPPPAHLPLRSQRDRLRVIVADAHPLRSAALLQQFLALGVPVSHCARLTSLEAALSKPADKRVLIYDEEFPQAGLDWLRRQGRAFEPDMLIMVSVAFGRSLKLCGDPFFGALKLIEKPYVPSRAVDSIEDWLQMATAQPAVVSSQLLPGLANRRLMMAVAEDNPVNQKVMRGFLRKLKQDDVMFYENGAQLVEQLESGREHYDVIFMDIDMPVMDGYEATRRVRELASQGVIRPPVIIGVSANVLPEQEMRARECGMNDYLRKPVRLEDIAQSLNRQSILST